MSRDFHLNLESPLLKLQTEADRRRSQLFRQAGRSTVPRSGGKILILRENPATSVRPIETRDVCNKLMNTTATVIPIRWGRRITFVVPLATKGLFIVPGSRTIRRPHRLSAERRAVLHRRDLLASGSPRAF